MNDEPIFTKCGRELYEKKCVFWVTGGTSQKKHPVQAHNKYGKYILVTDMYAPRNLSQYHKPAK